MSLNNRLRRLEKIRQVREPHEQDWLTEQQWLDLFERLGRDGVFAAEPDFPAALAEYRLALQTALTQTDPPFDPPADFMPNLADLPHLRLLNWRTESRFPDLWRAWTWLAEMLDRVVEGIPPVSDAEFTQLADWFVANEKRLSRWTDAGGSVDLGQVRKVSCGNLRYAIGQGWRATGAGRVAADIRQLRGRFE
jgi:hypothetical protein